MCTISFGERCRSIKVSVGWVFFNCNRTEWSAVWSEIICDFKIKRVHMESLIPNMISDQNYTTQSSVTEYLFITSVLKSQIQWLNEFFFLSGQVFHWSIILSLFEKSCKSSVSFSRNLMNQWISLPAVYCCLWDFFHHLFNLKADSCVWVSPYSPSLGTAAYCTISSGLWKKLLTSQVNSTKVWADGTCVDE